ncbi:nuclear transport factor 2 family protein [Gordonia sp. HNM0687]|uniref:Nuclear transport factor 2 family protein n=1 Tax=Gordonia mangrovi TaxID=2665643 RepID=A0A6L7GVA2_9ACTN|nr:nuclear transport factor 2 family protein [Gordonia mangrovi]MXP23503.1 nuclear transport factor 2 family protein [Gordonia mangrovi]UVF76603.1 nuclear transport factor 2 family protein [Gordonia mangrovi]
MRTETQRLERIEAQLDIQQLAIRYAIAVDERDVESWINLFVPDVGAGPYGSGRDALREFITPQIKQFYRSIHNIMGHRIILDDSDSAHGHVYCRAEHEVGDRWIAMAIRYDDRYRRVDGEWLFKGRREYHWYAADVTRTPQQAGFDEWHTSPHPPTVPLSTPSTWHEFWSGHDTSGITASPLDS